MPRDRQCATDFFETVTGSGTATCFAQNELLAFLYIARGSAGEVRSMLCFLERRPAFGNFKFQISNLKLVAESCSRQLRGWADYLQNSEIKGQRHLNEKARQHYDAAKTAEEFLQELLDRLPPDHPLRKRSRQL
jgi:hypothetical protein